MFGCCGMHGWYGFGAFGSVGWIIGLAFNLLVIGGFIWLLVWGIKRLTNNQGFSSSNNAVQSPKDILKARYARGEINREQYQAMLDDLEGK